MRFTNSALFFISTLLLTLSSFPMRADAVSDFLSSPAFPAKSSAFYIADLKTGKVRAAHNIETPLVPASIMKCVTTATLLNEVGADWRFLTPVSITGSISNGVLEGNLVIKGSGDPTIGSTHEPPSADFIKEIVDALKSKGVSEIAGKIVIDCSLWEGPAQNPQWATGDLSQSYGTGTHAFNYRDNASGKTAIKNPQAQFENRLKSALTAAGIRVGGKDISSKKHTQLGEHRSAPVDEIMRSCMMRSDNQFAEALFRTAAVADGGKGSFEGGASTVSSHWRLRGAPMKGVWIVDGSGLSRANRVTARFMGAVLRKMASNPYYASFFPLAGQEGTLKKFLAGTPLDSYVALKTGSMNGIQCYAGYKLDDNYEPTHVIVIMVNELGNRASTRATIEKALINFFANEYEPGSDDDEEEDS